MGPLMIDVLGTSLTQEDKELIGHPLVGGLILFARNYEDPKQVLALTDQIRAVKPSILIAADHEGGRVQRFREQFTKLPAMGNILSLCSNNVGQAERLAFNIGVLIAKEVQSVGVDISFAPVLDIDDISQVIGDRSFHNSPEVVTQLAEAFISGMHIAGMKVTGKHFPGHGSVSADSHIALPVDKRSKGRIFSHDMLPFKSLIGKSVIDALMPAHVIYPEIDGLSVGFSHYWLQTILRGSLGFQGVIFSDDLSMEGASSIGGFIERAEAAQEAGCDMLLVCNDRDASINVIENANISIIADSEIRLKRMLMISGVRGFEQLKYDPLWLEAKQVLNAYLN